MTKNQQDTAHMMRQLAQMGIDYETAKILRRISNTLRNWFEMECGTGDDRVTQSIERDGEEEYSKPYLRIQFATPGGGWHDTKRPVVDRERNAKLRLKTIMEKYPDLVPYIQGDCRGCALYILRKSDLRAGDQIDSVYTRGVAVY